MLRILQLAVWGEKTFHNFQLFLWLWQFLLSFLQLLQFLQLLRFFYSFYSGGEKKFTQFSAFLMIVTMFTFFFTVSTAFTAFTVSTLFTFITVFTIGGEKSLHNFQLTQLREEATDRPGGSDKQTEDGGRESERNFNRSKTREVSKKREFLVLAI